MRRFAPRSLLLALLALGLLAAPAVAVPTVSGEFDVPGISSNNKLVLGPDGNIWIATAPDFAARPLTSYSGDDGQGRLEHRERALRVVQPEGGADHQANQQRADACTSRAVFE